MKVQKIVPKHDFWRSIPKPFFVLAPMANVTDFAFRSMIAKYGKPDVIWTEFVSADGLDSVGKNRLLVDLKFSEKERPIVAQLFTGHPEAMKKAAKLCAELGFDGLDINMGCPDRAVEKQGGGATAMKDPGNALEVLRAARQGWEEKTKKKAPFELSKGGKTDNTRNIIPVSIKTRIGYNKVDMEWLKTLLEVHQPNLPALTVHLRTRKEMSDVPAHWELMPKIIKLRDEVQADINPTERTLIIGNGDVESVVDAVAKVRESGCDGVMIGRGIFGTPWLFQNARLWRDADPKTPEERLTIMVEHAKLFEKTFCGAKRLKNFAVMKKHFKVYVSGWDGAKELRVKLMETKNASQVDKIVKEYLKK
ncbi:MAG: hypothetical protein A3C79_01490 [Candidatus Taylorbacteria bacterium RIFCSPHIGHO2_02_FULL_45_28]|uniref:tRNA-dihydrouridine synthase n=1 Tax=Candidatus Taylorbacteria bacterium RIFCSPHIGHO2_12_FULL_45_16 TaxID=1802315 RepID=A0A1G2N0Y4_9BACT|nr:MAG: hypothetical protein A2830_03655 [Candidatus Taylorbacteria bacterium RIFCSPHIGHO2_01_FULL_44_110]OHA25111.1 MAG: hypothetical protein A3C79_01490 [Candidatus Taylorbacteria bacterium RIFCSPHIGHO2_02_FULL_45_28]OHA28992.1 MAG: hypothetical protein A3F51_01875 [Candidatus Taylorbacteria bacterium RIFCSPHIGHO2_12_FULL_45_16]OHA33110.1 MAG: hypothetical protein A3A23_03555 [Candidatus Taylorbacteria bacterium RIFCSPLOWO2_01_FULL_45_59]